MSVTVVRSGPDATAGSSFMRRSTNGTAPPIDTAIIAGQFLHDRHRLRYRHFLDQVRDMAMREIFNKRSRSVRRQRREQCALTIGIERKHRMQQDGRVKSVQHRLDLARRNAFLQHFTDFVAYVSFLFLHVFFPAEPRKLLLRLLAKQTWNSGACPL